MPKKIRELKSLLLQAGFTYKPEKGSHSKWIHPKLSKAIIISGKDGSDAKIYLEKQVSQALAELKKMEEEQTEETEE
ncbi:type II toxin-antitoxin system HicA family toxin [Scytonema sp. PCC 10023]|uniref:type II toxin-antitoxin system HicA family toxin n=1 Tax=Scytonema sp. PCC 10023 TaxID=1680591 RepID=UPI0039C68FFA